MTKLGQDLSNSSKTGISNSSMSTALLTLPKLYITQMSRLYITLPKDNTTQRFLISKFLYSLNTSWNQKKPGRKVIKIK